MIKRLKFIKIKKVRYYLLISICEILLVVAGILIALSIDNWNEERKDLQKEKQVLIQLREEYKSNLIQLEEKIASREDIIDASHAILKYLDNPKTIVLDSLLMNMVLLLNDPTFDPIANDLFISGNIRLIRNEELKRLLTNWSSEVIAVQEVEKRWAKLVDEQVAAFYIEMGIARNALDLLYKSNNPAPFALEKGEFSLKNLGKSRKEINMNFLAASVKLEGIVAISIGLNNSANLQAYILKKRIAKIIALIDVEIKKHIEAGR